MNITVMEFVSSHYNVSIIPNYFLNTAEVQFDKIRYWMLLFVLFYKRYQIMYKG